MAATVQYCSVIIGNIHGSCIMTKTIVVVLKFDLWQAYGEYKSIYQIEIRFFKNLLLVDYLPTPNKQCTPHFTAHM